MIKSEPHLLREEKYKEQNNLKKYVNILELKKLEIPSKNSLQDIRLWQSVQTNPAVYQELI